MRLPEYLMEAVEAEISQVDRRRLMQAVSQLSQYYKAGSFSSPALPADEHRAAYLAVRLPATFAVNRRVFAELRRRFPQLDVTSMLDLGAGPGTALFAAAEEFPALSRATLVEADERWISIGKKAAAAAPYAFFSQAQWQCQDLRSGLAFDAHDMVVISYAFGELSPEAMAAVVRQGWNRARKIMVVLEPGTPRGFAAVLAARSALVAGGAEILAPCPHGMACPMAARNDWCHFAERVERTSRHRQLKGGALGYEDEKFSYIVAGKNIHATPAPRIVRHPGRHSGHIQLELCMPDGQLRSTTVTRSEKDIYKAARRVGWGETWSGSRGES